MSRLGVTAALVAAVAAVAGCGAEDDQDAAADGALTTVVFRGPAYTGGWDAPLYLADELGYFREEGLDVKLEPSKGSGQVVADVESGGVEFGMVLTSALVVGDAQGATVQSIATPIGKSTFGYYAPESSGIESIADVEGRSIVTSSNNEAQMFASLNTTAGLQPGDVEPVLADITATAATYLSQKAEIAYSTVLVQDAINGSLPSRFLPEVDAGFNPPGYALVAKQGYIEANRDVVASFVRAVLRGFQAAKEDPAGAAEAVAEANPEVKADDVENEFSAMIPYFCSAIAEGSAYGLNQEDDWSLAVSQITEAAGLPSLDLDDLYTNAAFEGAGLDVGTC